MNPINPYSVNTLNYTVPFVAMNKSVKTSYGLDQQYTPEEYLHQSDAHMIFTMGEKPLDPTNDNQGHKRKMALLQSTLDLPLKIIIVTTKLESQNLSAEIYDPNAEVMFAQTTDPNEKKSKPQIRKYCNYCHKLNHFVPNCFRKQREDEERKRNSYSRSESPAKSFNQYFKAFQNQIHPNEQPSSDFVNYY